MPTEFGKLQRHALVPVELADAVIAAVVDVWLEQAALINKKAAVPINVKMDPFLMFVISRPPPP